MNDQKNKIEKLEEENRMLREELKKAMRIQFSAISDNERLRQRRMEIRPEVAWFAKRMERKMQLNDHKPHWSKSSMDYLIERLYQESNELWRALKYGEPSENIIQEAADVANFAMMIADNAKRVTAE